MANNQNRQANNAPMNEHVEFTVKVRPASYACCMDLNLHFLCLVIDTFVQRSSVHSF